MESNNNQTFTKFPNELLEHIMCSKLNASEIKILLCVVRYTYGFHRDQHELSQSFIQKATNISKRHLQEMTKSLISKSILIETKKATPITPRRLAINPNFDFISKLNENQEKQNSSKKGQECSEYVANSSEDVAKKYLNDNIANLDKDAEFSAISSAKFSNSSDVEFSNQERNPLKKDFKDNSRVDTSVNRGDIKPFNMNILKNQIAQQFLSVSTENNTYSFTLEEVVDIFVFYYEEYKKHTNTDHPILSNKNVKKIIEELPLCQDTPDNSNYPIELCPDFYPDMIKKHFETSYQNCDYNILHFISGSIRALRYYEVIYE